MIHRLGWNITNTATLGGAGVPGYIGNTGSGSCYAIQCLLIQYLQYFKRNLGNLMTKNALHNNKNKRRHMSRLYVRLLRLDRLFSIRQEMTRKNQLDNVINKAYRAFRTCRSTFGETWGLKSKAVYWIYTAVVKLIVTNPATAWWSAVKFKTSKAEASKLQRIACLGITRALHASHAWYINPNF
jgi:hypothetical protein